MKIKTFGKSLIGFLAIALLAGCTPRQPAFVVHPGGWRNYRCVSGNVHFPYSRLHGVATMKAGTCMNALGKCTAYSRFPSNCLILHCSMR